MSVYFIQCGERGPIKIGQTINIRARLGYLQSALHEPLIVRGILDDVTEYEMHRKFERLHIRGEWFHFRGPLKKFVVSLPPIAELPYTSSDGWEVSDEIALKHWRDLGIATNEEAADKISKLNKAAGGKAITIAMLQKKFPGGSGRPSGWQRGQKRND